ncbi:alpha/beta fold hydrolase [Comamonas sp. GB3 AK4-5]|uniref:alpha/beta fold hydrolase n=1 Tax=Comamonas sp. GB3 AK4-5 TaxID=3231487 RepID=UPI00351EA2A2
MTFSSAPCPTLADPIPQPEKPITLVLLPGMDGTGLLFGPLVAALREVWPVTIVAYSHDTASQTYAGLQTQAEQALPPDGPLVLLGESFSGPIAVALAAKHPGRVAGLVLCCSFLRNPRPSLRWLRGLASIPAPLPPGPVLSAMLFGRFATPGLRTLLNKALSGVSSAALRARLRAVLDIDARAQAHSLAMPVLYLQASHDRLVPADAAAAVQQCCPQAVVQSLNAPHCLLQAAPEAAAAALSAFIQGLAGTQTANANAPVLHSRM